jgi:hypothetical protein
MNQRTCPDCGKPIFDQSPGNVGAMKPFTSAMHTPAARNPGLRFEQRTGAVVAAGAERVPDYVRTGGTLGPPVPPAWTDYADPYRTYKDAWQYAINGRVAIAVASVPPNEGNWDGTVRTCTRPKSPYYYMNYILTNFPKGPVQAIEIALTRISPSSRTPNENHDTNTASKHPTDEIIDALLWGFEAQTWGQHASCRNG